MPVSRELEPHQITIVSLTKKLNSDCLVLLGCRNGFERDFHKQKVVVSQSNLNILV